MLLSNETGRFFDDYCNWQRFAELDSIICSSPAVFAAAQLMQLKTVKVFHDHVLVKEPGTREPTP